MAVKLISRWRIQTRTSCLTTKIISVTAHFWAKRASVRQRLIAPRFPRVRPKALPPFRSLRRPAIGRQVVKRSQLWTSDKTGPDSTTRTSRSQAIPSVSVRQLQAANSNVAQIRVAAPGRSFGRGSRGRTPVAGSSRKFRLRSDLSAASPAPYRHGSDLGCGGSASWPARSSRTRSACRVSRIRSHDCLGGLDPRKSDNFPPLLCFCRNVPPEISRRTWQH